MDQSQSHTQFDAFLLNSETCPQEAANELIQAAKDSWVPLGRILVTEGKLQLRQIGQILMAQADHPKARFGDLAVELGCCSQSDVSEAMRFQVEHCPHVLDLALKDDRVDQSKLLLALTDHVRHANRIIDQLNDTALESAPSQASPPR